MANASPTDAQVLAALRATFGFTAMRPLQEQVIRAVLRRQDAFVLMPTGGGKSLCYQLPAILQPGVTVVVSPLIALMKDQVDRLVSLGVSATFINSSLDSAEVNRRQAEVAQGKVKLLYVAPERLMLPGFLRLLSGVDVALFAIDEAHCISEWGHDFRPEYRELRRLRDLFPKTPISAFTATATRRVQADILAQLRLHEPLVARGSLDRPNLHYQVWPKQAAYRSVIDYLSARREASGIIYVQTRAGAERLAERLQGDGFRAMAYHAGLSADDRRLRQETFLDDGTRIMVATIAFGMGIDKPNIRFVVHYDLPKNLEGYYQESGRAGRDGQPSDAVLLYSYGDAIKHEHFIREKPSASERKFAQEQLAQMVSWAESTACRREALLGYFDDTLGERPEACCDICQPSSLGQRPEMDCTVAAQMLLACAKRTGETFGSVYLIHVLAGSQEQRILENGHEKLSTYGIGKDRSRQEWRHIAHELLRKGYIRQDSERFNAVKVTPLGEEVLFQGRTVSLPPLPEMPYAPVAARRRPDTLGDSPRESLEMFRQGMPPAEIAAERGLALSTIEGHLAQAIEAGEQLDLERLVSDAKRGVIEETVRRLGPGPLKPIKEALGDDYTYGEIRVVQALMQEPVAVGR
ncbi:MAG: RecQ family ATP-dependent DNA helicase [Dehalococcoidia bacterium]